MENNIADIEIEKVMRTKRKTIALHITDDATLIIKAPFGATDKTIRRVIFRHKKWIEQKKREVEARTPKFSPKKFVNDEVFLYLGEYYRLKVVDNQETPLRFDSRFYLSKNTLSRAKEVFIEWYKGMAHEKISERVLWHSQKRGFKHNKVNITNAQRRWGSCSPNRNLNFSWRLVMAPLPVVDYVVVHELVHLTERNHAKSFWSTVKILMPAYEKHKDWLKKNDHLLRL
ncbi:M48 family metallopeptidase [Thermodesulfovibrionales bacterium]|nr:M48 family metallopeptidase [Thermodesulfovibrionales bacterium]MCL0086318.1 M48 family metallopeptidase [Thermodesulfovibrionales bacterium]MCL0086656.1 M48 family metallopeptidase [Thermodesulfovibrionales bacterium]